MAGEAERAQVERVAAPPYSPSEAELASVVTEHELGKLAGWRRLEGGVVNPALLLDLREGPATQAVLRVNVRNPELPKVAKEAWALQFLRAQSPAGNPWRVPGVLAADTSRATLPYDYLLLEFLPGRSGWQVWDEANSSQRTSLLRQIGEILASLHAVPLPGTHYGGWDSNRGCLGTHDDWRALAAESTHQNAAEIEALGLQRVARLDEARAWLDAHLATIPRRPRRVLAHHDFHFSNMLV